MNRPPLVNNASLMRLAALDLRHGIPSDLYFGADDATQAYLRDEHARQRRDHLRELTDATGERKRAAQRLLKKPATSIDDTPRGQMLHLQSLLFEVSALAGRLARALPSQPDQPEGVADASPPQESQP